MNRRLFGYFFGALLASSIAGCVSTPTRTVPGGDAGALGARAESGDAESQYALGLRYLNGTEGVDQDFARAARHFETAALAGHGRAQVFLGRMYFRGEGVERDFAKSFFWLTLAKPQEPEAAEYFIKKLRRVLSAQEIAAAERDAKAFIPR